MHLTSTRSRLTFSCYADRINRAESQPRTRSPGWGPVSMLLAAVEITRPFTDHVSWGNLLVKEANQLCDHWADCPVTPSERPQTRRSHVAEAAHGERGSEPSPAGLILRRDPTFVPTADPRKSHSKKIF